MDDVTVRDSTRDDIPVIERIYGHYVRYGLASFEEAPPTAAELARRRDAVREQDLPHLVATAGGIVLGYAYATAYRSRPAYRYTVEDSIYVDEHRTGRGIGRALLAAVIARCEEAGRRQIVAIIGDSANEPSIRLHQSLGFVPVGTLREVGFKLGRWVDTVLMQRSLGPPGTSPRVT